MLELIEGNTLVAIVVGVFAISWGIMLICAPMFWYGTWIRSKETSQKLTELVSLQERANDMIAAQTSEPSTDD
ncbi:MAG: hypothetical protein AAGI72_15350 [Pseudomonadota bacterium]